MAKQIAKTAFENGMVIETAGPEDNVVKIMPPLIMDEPTILRGLNVLEESIDAAKSQDQFQPSEIPA